MAHTLRVGAGLICLAALLCCFAAPRTAAQTSVIGDLLTTYGNYGNGASVSVVSDSGPGFAQSLKADTVPKSTGRPTDALPHHGKRKGRCAKWGLSGTILPSGGCRRFAPDVQDLFITW